MSEQSIGERVTKKFQEQGHAYYDELIELVNTEIAALELELKGADKLEKQMVAAARTREDYIDAMQREFNTVIPYIQHVGNCGTRGSNAPMDERCICGLRQTWWGLEHFVERE